MLSHTVFMAMGSWTVEEGWASIPAAGPVGEALHPEAPALVAWGHHCTYQGMMRSGFFSATAPCAAVSMLGKAHCHVRKLSALGLLWYTQLILSMVCAVATAM